MGSDTVGGPLGTIRRAIVAGSVAFTFFFAAITFSPLVLWWATLLSGPWGDPAGDVLIVLGNEVQPDGIVGETSYLRTVYAVRAWREGGFSRVIFTGAGAAPAMRTFAISQGVPAGAIDVENESLSTRENALRTAELLRGKAHGKLVMLTSDYHAWRAARVFRKAGLQVEPRPFPDIRKRANARMNRWPAFGALIVETTKVIWYWRQGWI
ncbi:MAG: YdcF family protein [Acidobacteriota bacterium]|nr:YdcF family protein [Acidobacteriota bacterium]